MGVPVPSPVKDICDAINPCKWVCPKPTNLGGCATYECNGPRKICFDINVPNVGDCSISFDTSPSSSAVRTIPLSIRPCPRCGFGGSTSTGVSDCMEGGSRRRLEQSKDMPAHVTPYHRSLVNGCQECSLPDLKTAFRETDNRQDVFQEVETLLITCIGNAQSSSSSIKSAFPCILRRTFELIDLIPLLSDVIKCQLSREVCYDNSDLLNSPGLVNLFIQAKRFESLTNLILLPYGGSLTGDPRTLLVPFDELNRFNDTKITTFVQVLVNALADSSESGEFVSAMELDGLLNVGLATPGDADIVQFANTWNQSLSLWNQGVFSVKDLPANHSDPFFDLDRTESLMSAFLSARASIRNEHFAGFGDAWLSAVEAQQLEEAKQLAGVCASVRVRIEQELTLTRVGFEARLEISNEGDFPLENVTGEHEHVD